MTASLSSSRVALVAITLSVTACAGGLSLGGGTGTGTAPSPATTSSTPTASSTAGSSPATAATPAATPDALAFVGLTAEKNTENARKLKEELRGGLLAKIFDETVLVDEVTAICGAKIWDQCDVAASPSANALGWPEWTFKRKDADRAYRYPDMFYAKAEPRWSAMAVEYILRSDRGAELVKLVQGKCGTQFHDGCEVRQRHNGHYVLTVKRDGEVIHVMDTLTQWRRDL